MNEEQVKNAVVVQLNRMNYRILGVSAAKEHGVDIVAVYHDYGRRFLVETKGDSPPSAKNPASGREVRFTQALGQIVTRIRPASGYCYGIGLPDSYRGLALRRIRWQVAKHLNLHLFLVRSRTDVDVVGWKGIKAEKDAPKKIGPGKEKARKLSLVDAAIQVMRETGKPMTCQEVVDVVLSRKLWHGKSETPAATLYSLILRDIQKGGRDAQFKKVGRGHFVPTA